MAGSCLIDSESEIVQDRSFLVLRPILSEVNDLKRIRVAGRPGSLADQGFARAWGALLDGQTPGRVALREAAFAVASARLGGIDFATLAAAGLDQGEIEGILRTAVAELCGPLGERWSVFLEPGLRELGAISDANSSPRPTAEFVTRLQAQPRAGATRPGHARLVLEPPENHAEHCYITAVYAVLVAPIFDADPGTAFLAGLAHHFHNVFLPDSGFAGEALLGEHLVPIMDRFTLKVVDQLPVQLGRLVQAARLVLADVATPEGRAFHTGDVYDRVLQMEQYARVAAFETRQALVDLDLVHPGPLQEFHLRVLAAAELWS